MVLSMSFVRRILMSGMGMVGLARNFTMAS